MGIRTRETSEYFPKVNSPQATAANIINITNSNNNNNSTPTTATTATGAVVTTESTVATATAKLAAVEKPSVDKVPAPISPVISEVKVPVKALKVSEENGKAEADNENQEQKGLKSNSKDNGNKGANNNKIKNGIVKVNSKMKKGMRIMMEKSNKILERSRNCKKQTKKVIVVKPRPPPARSSARLCRKSSGESNDSSGCGGRSGRSEDPLRTVELIKRPLELRDPATKLLYLASMGLYPMSDPESDSTPIVIISEEVVSPGGRRGKMRCMELPLMPNWGNSHNHNHNHHHHHSSKRQVLSDNSDNSMLLQIAQISTPSVTAAIKTNGHPFEDSAPQKSPDLPTDKNGMRKSRKKSAEKGTLPVSSETPKPISNKIPDKLIPTENTEQQKLNAPPMPISTQITTSIVKEISINCGTGTNAVENLSTKNFTESSFNHIVKPPAQPKNSVSCQKKRKSLETIIKEIPMLKPDLPLQKVQSENLPAPSCPVESLSCNPILEGLMNKPVKKRAPKRKPQMEPNQNLMSHFQKPITMTVPLQPAPGLPINSGISIKELANKSKKAKFQLPTLLPASLLFSSLLPNNGEQTFVEKPKKPRKPRAKKPKEAINNFSHQNNFLPVKTNQFPQLPYLPPHLEAFFHNALPLQTIVPRDPDEALDLCVKARTSNDFKVKKSKDMMPQSILKPMSSMRSMEDDAPLNLVLSRPQGHLSSNPGKDPLPLKTLPENKTIGKPQENLDSVKKMLARLHTKIAPAVDGVQLITIE